MEPTLWTDDLRGRLDELLDEYRAALHDCVEGLSEEEVRASLVPSRTTLLGLVKHVTFVERVWFGQAVTGQSRADLGVAETPDESFVLTGDDTIASIQAAYREACDDSRRAASALDLGGEVTGRGPRAVWAIHVHLLRELAQHTGHAEILREQVIARR